MIRSSWRVIVLKAWFECLNSERACTVVEFLAGTLYVERGRTKYNVDKLKKRGLL